MARSAAGPDIRRAEERSDDSITGRLDSWKEIAAYLGRGVRTVQRWERDEGLPVHRLAHEKRGSVYALRHEVTAWWESRRQQLATEPSDDRTEPVAQLQRVTRLGAATFWPALSSDGRMVAYVSDAGREGAAPQIWLQQIGGAATRLTSECRQCKELSFAFRDTCILFTAEGDAGQNVYLMPTLGGEAKLLRRNARAARISPDGKWLAYVSLDQPGLLRIDALDQGGVHKVTPALVDVSFTVWSEDGAHLVVQAHPDATIEPEFWIVPVDGGPTINTGVMQRLRQRGLFPLSSAPAWVGDSLVFSVITREGVNVWRQRLTPVTFQPQGDSERLTGGTDFDAFPAAAAGRVVFVNTHPDQNLWSIPIDVSTGVARGALRRLTRGPGVIMHLSLTRDGRTLSYFASRGPVSELRLRDLHDSSDRLIATGVDEGVYPAIAPGTTQLAFSVRTAGPRAMRPVYVTDLGTETTRLVCDDCGRPRQWFDERHVLIERFGGRLNTLAILDTSDGSRSELASSASQSVSNPRLSPDGRFIAFDATRPGAPPNVVVAPLGDARSPIPESAWTIVERGASHPFWSADGGLLYYLPTTPTLEQRNVVKARRLDSEGRVDAGEAFVAFASNEMVVPALISGCAPIAAPDQLVFILGDFRGDVWMMDIDSGKRR